MTFTPHEKHTSSFPSSAQSTPYRYDILDGLRGVALLFPFTVWLGAQRVTLQPRTQRACQWLGRLSYPLYLAHYPIVYLFFTWIDTHHDVSVAKQAFVATATFLLCLATAYAAMRLWDEPMRRWLNGRKKG